jgi:hypothetical protein
LTFVAEKTILNLIPDEKKAKNFSGVHRQQDITARP